MWPRSCLNKSIYTLYTIYAYTINMQCVLLFEALFYVGLADLIY